MECIIAGGRQKENKETSGPKDELVTVTKMSWSSTPRHIYLRTNLLVCAASRYRDPCNIELVIIRHRDRDLLISADPAAE